MKSSLKLFPFKIDRFLGISPSALLNADVRKYFSWFCVLVSPSFSVADEEVGSERAIKWWSAERAKSEENQIEEKYRQTDITKIVSKQASSMPQN